ncbi:MULTISPECIES: hypothetical protein [unclassified Rhizobium]|uniref:hypothetical protein n=1 Tax=unclassified Rhizobium TaxID=2613769 RepID=UPI001ADBAEEA|nr:MULTISPECIES: hypothetical protein [unclassified Rhizobium]MBO9097634.1 hypothetical protein [Rhizobium sp. L58/93]MBO9183829.1 hypothetical protein [Rhizobium sp. E27B/91]QXZ84080.1 hypothetical protein J5287_00420 [Rhizobium sp. K1/93]QXZ88407.1 hypothetical protein J5280_09580 [Rhizobium sp. K15/93]QYA00992.1 hypothetical protein J5278_14835 [Rhizobium sp. B21/90]
MRKSWADYKRESRKRKRDKNLARERELNTSVFRKPFSEFMAEDRRTGFGAHYLILGNEWWSFEDDKGIQPADVADIDEDDFNAAFNSLGKAELVLSVLEEVVETLAQDIAVYKRRELETRISEIQKPQLTGTDANKFLDDLEHLKKMRDRLNTRVRNTRPQTRASGE